MSHLYIHACDLRVLGSGAVSWLGGGSVIQPETHLAPGSVCMSDHPETSLSLLMPWWLLHRTCFSIRWVRALAETPASEDRHRGRQLMASQQPCCTVGQQPLSQRVEAPLALLQIDTAEGRGCHPTLTLREGSTPHRYSELETWTSPRKVVGASSWLRLRKHPPMRRNMEGKEVSVFIHPTWCLLGSWEIEKETKGENT